MVVWGFQAWIYIHFFVNKNVYISIYKYVCADINHLYMHYIFCIHLPVTYMSCMMCSDFLGGQLSFNKKTKKLQSVHDFAWCFGVLCPLPKCLVRVIRDHPKVSYQAFQATVRRLDHYTKGMFEAFFWNKKGIPWCFRHFFGTTIFSGFIFAKEKTQPPL